MSRKLLPGELPIAVHIEVAESTTDPIGDLRPG
jgi:hypothetical protein